MDPSTPRNIDKWIAQTMKELKRKRETDELSEYEGVSSPSRASSASGPARRHRKQKSRASSDRQNNEEYDLVDKLEGLEYLGRTKEYRRLDTELKIAPPCPNFKAFVDENPGLFSDCRFEDYRFVEANSLVEINHLKRFCREYADVPAKYEAAVAVAYEIVLKKLTLDELLVFPGEEELDKVRYEGDKFAGIEYATRGLKTRREAHNVALDDAKVAYGNLLAGRKVDPHVNRIGGRGKLVTKKKMDEQGADSSAGRLIFMTSHRDLLLNGLTEQKLTHAYKHPAFPISVGKSWWHGGVEEFLARFADKKMFSCFDAAKFDSSLPPWLIKLAILILRQQFRDGLNPQYDAYWQFVEDGLIYAPVFLDNGMMFRRKGGSTSGHSHNTLMQSVCTLICVYTCFIILSGDETGVVAEEAVHSEALGDDQHTGAKEPLDRFTIDHVAPLAMEIFGIDWTGDKSFNTRRLTDDREGDFEGTQYLGKYFRWYDDDVDGLHVEANLPYRPFLETVLRLYYPERGKLDLQDAWMRAVGHYADGAGNTRTRSMLEAYLDWLEERGGGGETTWDAHWVRKFTEGGNRSSMPIPARRISYAAWLALVISDSEVFTT